MSDHFTAYSRKRFNYLANKIESLYHEAAVMAGLSDTSLLLLYILYEEGVPCPQKTIYQESGLSRSTVNSAIRKLEKDGVLYLAPGDRRSTVIHLTEKGQTLMESAARPLIELENEIFAAWSEEEQQLYLHLTERYAQDFQQKLPGLYTGEAHENSTF